MRRRRAERRDIASDPKYDNRLVAKFINNIMLDGKKKLLQKELFMVL